jgi:hypothetical protein
VEAGFAQQPSWEAQATASQLSQGDVLFNQQGL